MITADGRLGGRRLPCIDIESTKRKTLCEQALRIQWTGMVNFPRVDPILKEQISLLGAVTNAIAHSAAKWGSAKTKKKLTSIQKITR